MVIIACAKWGEDLANLNRAEVLCCSKEIHAAKRMGNEYWRPGRMTVNVRREMRSSRRLDCTNSYIHIVLSVVVYGSNRLI